MADGVRFADHTVKSAAVHISNRGHVGGTFQPSLNLETADADPGKFRDQ